MKNYGDSKILYGFERRTIFGTEGSFGRGFSGPNRVRIGSESGLGGGVLGGSGPQSCDLADLGENRFRASARNRKKNGPKMDFGLTGKIGKKSPENWKNRSKMGFFSYFRAIFPIFGRFFRDFPVEAKIHFRAIFFFSDFGRKPEIDFLPGRQDRNHRGRSS